MKPSITFLLTVPFFFTLSLESKAAGKGKKFSDEDEVQIVEAVDCSLKQDTRKLEIHTRGAGCVLEYFKFDQASEIAHSRNGVDVCKGAMQKTQKNLESSGYACARR